MSGHDLDVGSCCPSGYEKRMRKQEWETKEKEGSELNSKTWRLFYFARWEIIYSKKNRIIVIRKIQNIPNHADTAEPQLEHNLQESCTQTLEKRRKGAWSWQVGSVTSFEEPVISITAFPEDPKLWLDVTDKLRAYFSEKQTEKI